MISQAPEAGDASTDSLVDSKSFVRPLAWDVRPSELTQVGFVALDLINVLDIFTHRACVMKVPPAFLRGGVPRDHFWYGIGQPGENHERHEIVHLPPQNVVVQTNLEEGSGEEQTLGSVHQICSGTVVGVVV